MILNNNVTINILTGILEPRYLFLSNNLLVCKTNYIVIIEYIQVKFILASKISVYKYKILLSRLITIKLLKQFFDNSL
ncbi:MAG: hypothetical protein SCALA702_06080 [Melioribacteraceae bacterium]|nr:MAG: hypothetical protein SCALA702_06080 [Melioribacteraceae bacterium]